MRKCKESWESMQKIGKISELIKKTEKECFKLNKCAKKWEITRKCAKS